MNQFEYYVTLLQKEIRNLDRWRESYGSLDSISLDGEENEAISEILSRLAEKLKGNYPFHHPRYAGQMLKPPHPIAWLAYSLAMTINPNNHALDGGPPTSEMEKECVRRMAEMAGYREPYLGHLTSGGTIANLEALFVARELHPGKSIAASANAHYTHERMCRLLHLPFLKLPTDTNGYPDLEFLRVHSETIGTLVVTLGTTGTGYVEPLADLIPLCRELGIRIHADAAYGGFFKLLEEQLSSKRHWQLFGECDSIVIDPHKHGLQPYGCGSVLFKDPSVGSFFKHDSPYTYFTSDELHLGEISLECSRAGASAAAFWATLELLPLTKGGLGGVLQTALDSARSFAARIDSHPGFSLFMDPELDIVTWFKRPDSCTISALNESNSRLFQKGMELNEEGFFLSLFSVPSNQFLSKFPDFEIDEDEAVLLRSVFMKEEHLTWVDLLAERIFSAST